MQSVDSFSAKLANIDFHFLIDKADRVITVKHSSNPDMQTLEVLFNKLRDEHIEYQSFTLKFINTSEIAVRSDAGYTPWYSPKNSSDTFE